MNSLNLKVRRNIIIVEDWNHGKISKGANLFCGCCGYSMGKATQDIKMPCNLMEMHQQLEFVSFEVGAFGLRHKTCKHTLFPFASSLKFMPLEKFRKQFRKETV